MLCAVSLKRMLSVAVVARGESGLIGRLRGAFNAQDIEPTFVTADEFIVQPDSLLPSGLEPAYSSVIIFEPPLDELLLAAEMRGVHQVVFVSSAMVYGAWPNNPVPLTETAPLRPSNTFDTATKLMLAEEVLAAWQMRSRESRKACVLRPALSLAAEGTPRVVSALAAGVGLRAGEDDPPAQFLHLDDLASAIATVVACDADGVFNVAPDGWISGEVMRGLASTPARLRLPGPIADVFSHLRWVVQRGPLPPGLREYTRWPWVISNDALRSLGWQPQVTNEQAYVEGTQTPWYSMVSPKRKQELSLGVTALSLIAVFVTLVRQVSRRR